MKVLGRALVAAGLAISVSACAGPLGRQAGDPTGASTASTTTAPSASGGRTASPRGTSSPHVSELASKPPAASPTRPVVVAGFSQPGDHRLPAGTVTLQYDVTRAASAPLKAKLTSLRKTLSRSSGIAIYLAGGTKLAAADLATIQALGRPTSAGGLGFTTLTRLYIYNLHSVPAGIECTKTSGLACAGQYATGGWPFLYFNGWWDSWVRDLVLDDLLSIAPGAFSNTKFATISFKSVRTVGAMAFGHGPYSRLQEVYLPLATTIGHDAFRRNQYLVKVTLPNVTKIDDYAFDDASRLQVFDAPKLVTIGRNALNDSHVLSKVNLPAVEYIGINCFDLNGDAKAGTGLKELRLPKLKKLDKNALSGFGSLTYVYAPVLTDAGQNAVIGNANLVEFYAPKLIHLYPNTFTNNPKLTKLVIPRT